MNQARDGRIEKVGSNHFGGSNTISVLAQVFFILEIAFAFFSQSALTN